MTATNVLSLSRRRDRNRTKKTTQYQEPRVFRLPRLLYPGYLIPTTFQRDRLDGNRGGSCDRGGGFYRRFESSPFSGGGDDSLVVVIVAGSTTVASTTTMVRGETRLQ